MIGSYVGSHRIVRSYGILPTLPFGFFFFFFFFKWDSFWEDNLPKPTSPTGYQKPNNEFKS